MEDFPQFEKNKRQNFEITQWEFFYHFSPEAFILSWHMIGTPKLCGLKLILANIQKTEVKGMSFELWISLTIKQVYAASVIIFIHLCILLD